jgi:hypothetical protein
LTVTEAPARHRGLSTRKEVRTVTARRFAGLALSFAAGFLLAAAIPVRLDPNRLGGGAAPPAVAEVLVRGPLPPGRTLPVALGRGGDAPESVNVRPGDGLIRVTLLGDGPPRHAFVIVPGE